MADGTELAVLQGQGRFRDIWTSWSESFNAAIDNNSKHAVLLASSVHLEGSWLARFTDRALAGR